MNKDTTCSVKISADHKKKVDKAKGRLSAKAFIEIAIEEKTSKTKSK